MKSVAIIGSNGQLGTDLVKVFTESGWKVNPLTHSSIQIENIDSVNEALLAHKSDWVINTAAYHKVVDCEIEIEKTWEINVAGSANISKVANELGSKVLYISTDYVFDGNRPIPYQYLENDKVAPLNVYGQSKAAGEIAVLSSNKDNIVARVSSIFGAAGSSGKGSNFIETILNLAKKQNEIEIVSDLYMSPTYTLHAAKKIRLILEKDFCGIIHCSNSEYTSWKDFASYFIKKIGFKTNILSKSNDCSTKPLRPTNSSLSNNLANIITRTDVSWQFGVDEYLREKRYI